MREILFRAKDIKTGEWVAGVPYFEYMICGMTSAYYDDEVPMSVQREFDYVEIDPATIGEYTGMTDKNGVKIFEGDILKGKINGYSYTSPVVFDNYTWYAAEDYLSFWDGYGDIEIVGNIHDNPELLKGER